MNEKQHRPDWTEYFLDIAKAVGRRATCLRRRYGAIIVKDKIIISTGYNGAPRGEANCIDTGNCERERLHVPKGQNYELCVAVHAEQNAIIKIFSIASVVFLPPTLVASIYGMNFQFMPELARRVDAVRQVPIRTVLGARIHPGQAPL